jgi:AcrR family transcriptional regulator
MPVSKGESIDLDRTRGKVVKAATELFYRDGTHAGINELTERAGISKLTLYRHFGSKEGLLEEVLRQRSDRVVSWLKAAADTPADPVDRVLAVFDALRGWYAEQGFRGCAIVNAATESPSRSTREVARMHLGRHLELLTALARDTGVADPDLTGRQLLILLEGATVVAALTGEPHAADDARRVAETLLARRPEVHPGENLRGTS